MSKSHRNPSSELFIGKTVQSQYIEQPSLVHRESTTEKYRNFMQNIKNQDDTSPIKGKDFMGESLRKRESKFVPSTSIFPQKSLLLNPPPIYPAQHRQLDSKNNEEIKQYLRNVDTMLESRRSQAKITPQKRKSQIVSENVEYREPDEHILGKSKYLEENEGLRYLEKKYLTSEIKQKMNHSTVLLKSSTFWDSEQNCKLGEILCMHCQEFINPEEIDAHSRICDSEVDSKKSLLNDKIENIKLLLIINYKNSSPEESEEYIELESFIFIGTAIIDEILHNNSNPKKTKENLEDLKELFYSMNRLRTKRMAAVKSLIQRLFQIIDEKISMLEGPQNNERSVWFEKEESPKLNQPSISGFKKKKEHLMDYFEDNVESPILNEDPDSKSPNFSPERKPVQPKKSLNV